MPQAALPPTPLMFPYVSAVGAATKAASMCRSPASIARARPPWVYITAGVASSPLAIASATGPET